MKDPIINKIVTEWAYRVPDGKPKVGDSYHMVLLEKTLNYMKLPKRFNNAFLKRLREIEFANQSSFDNYNKKHKMRPTTKVTIGDKETTVGDAEGNQKKHTEEEKIEFLLDMADVLLTGSTEESGVGRFNMSKEDLGKYKSYLEGNKPEIPNYDISDNEVNEVVGILKSTMGGDYSKFVQRVRKKGDPPKQYSTGELGQKRFFNCLKHYLQTGGRSTITGEVVPFSEAQLDHVTSLDNGGVDGPENWEWMESRFNQFKGALSDEDVMNNIQKELSKSPEEDKLKSLNQALAKYSKQAYIDYYANKFKNGGNAGITEESLNKMTGTDMNALIKGWNKNHPEGSEFFVPRYGSKKDPITGKDVDRKSGRASGGRIASKPELISRILEKTRATGLSIPTKAETDEIDRDFQKILDEVERQKGDIKDLKTKIKQSKSENKSANKFMDL